MCIQTELKTIQFAFKCRNYSTQDCLACNIELIEIISKGKGVWLVKKGMDIHLNHERSA